MKVTERGWIGHFIMGDRCLFRRNTLIEHNGTKIVVSSVGNLIDIHANNYPNKITVIPLNTIEDKKYWFETRVFYTDNTEYLDADVENTITYGSAPENSCTNRDIDWNAFHEKVIEEMQIKLALLGGIK